MGAAGEVVWIGSAGMVIQRARELDVAQRAPDPLLLGRHLLALGIGPGPRVGDITRVVYEMQLDGRVRNVEEAIAAARKIIESEG